MSEPQADPDQAVIEGLFPGWTVWRDGAGRRHASPRDQPAVVLDGEDWRGLIEQMRRADARIAGPRFLGLGMST
jgi:hypothetical protein